VKDVPPDLIEDYCLLAAKSKGKMIIAKQTSSWGWFGRNNCQAINYHIITGSFITYFLFIP